MSPHEEGAIPDIAPVDDSLQNVDDSGADFSPERWPKWMEAGRKKGPNHLTPTQRRILALIVERQSDNGAVALTKREIAEYLHKSEKTVLPTYATGSSLAPCRGSRTREVRSPMRIS